jgi:hypothetical protein
VPLLAPVYLLDRDQPLAVDTLKIVNDRGIAARMEATARAYRPSSIVHRDCDVMNLGFADYDVSLGSFS